MAAMPDPIPFAGNTLDRESIRRRDRSWLETLLAAEESRYLPVWRLHPLLKTGDERGLAWAKREFFEDVETPEPVLLGTEGDVAHFAVDVSSVEEPDSAFGLDGVASFEDLRASVAQLAASDAGIAAQARSLVDWHARHRHCAVCGGHTRSVLGGANRVCFDCQAEHFPRTDPVAIAVVVRDGQCLLGRSPGWPDHMFSALAGFVEPGETVEDAVRREVMEEASVRVGRVRYHTSQPWPFPSSLMIGCIAEGESAAIEVDPAELEEARWFSRDALRAALDGRRDDLWVPPPFAIAHHLIRAWAVEDESA